MARICQQKVGLFPSPDEINLSCSCPDWASMCKHVAAVLYGVGARLDEQPELLFKLREVNEKELIARAATGLPLARKGPATGKVLEGVDLSEIFGLEMAQGPKPETKAAPKKAKPGRARTPAGREGKLARAASGKAPRAANGKAARAASGKTARAASGKAARAASGKAARAASGKAARAASGKSARRGVIGTKSRANALAKGEGARKR